MEDNIEKITSPSIAEDVFKKYSKNDDKKKNVERTLAIIKPDGMKYREKIIKRIYKAGFHVLQKRMIKLTIEQSSEFYKNKYGEPNYPMLVCALSEGPILALCISKPDAIKYWQILMGSDDIDESKRLWPGSLRALYGDTTDEFRNLLHGSEDLEAATHEIHFFFPNMILEPIFDKIHQHRYLQGAVNPILWDGLYQVAKCKPDEPLIWLAKWLLENNPYKPHITAPDPKMLEKVAELEKVVDDSKITEAKAFCPNLDKMQLKDSSICTELENMEELVDSDERPCNDIELIGKCLKCPNCGKVIRFVHCQFDHDYANKDCCCNSIQSNESEGSVINCICCNEVFLIGPNIFDPAKVYNTKKESVDDGDSKTTTDTEADDAN